MLAPSCGTAPVLVETRSGAVHVTRGSGHNFSGRPNFLRCHRCAFGVGRCAVRRSQPHRHIVAIRGCAAYVFLRGLYVCLGRARPTCKLGCSGTVNRFAACGKARSERVNSHISPVQIGPRLCSAAVELGTPAAHYAVRPLHCWPAPPLLPAGTGLQVRCTRLVAWPAPGCSGLYCTAMYA